MSDGREPAEELSTTQSVAPSTAVADKGVTYGSIVLCPESSGEEDRISYCRGVVAVVNQKDSLSVDLDPEKFGGKSSKRWTGNTIECMATYSAVELQKSSDNLLDLSEMCDEAVVDALRWRFIQRDEVFTYCGRVLLAFNPFRGNQKAQEPNLPHILDLCSKVMKMRSITGRPCAVVLSGESGSGKTEMARQMLRFFSPEGSSSSTSTTTLGRMSIILEAFGNANLTGSMPNASRFGLFCKILPSGAGLAAASCTQLLLERSRISARDELERSFHVFYQLLAGLTKVEKQGLDLLNLVDYAYLASSDAANASEQEDAKNFAKLVPALADIGVKGSVKDDLFRCLGGILACGNTKWTEEDVSGHKVFVCTDPRALQQVARCFGLAEVDALRDVLAHGSDVSAQRRTDNLAETIYAGIFGWLVKRLNSQLGDIPPKSRWIGVLDLPGFGSLEFNSFEQLLFNHADEQVHRLFLDKTLIEEYKALTAEKIDSVSEISGNDDVIKLVEASSPQPGIFSLLEKYLDSSGSDDKFVDACSESFKTSQLLSVRPVSEEDSPWASGKDKPGHRFTIRHTLRPVEYCVAGFRERSTSHLPDQLVRLLQHSTNSIIHDIATTEDLAKQGSRGRQSCDDIKQIMQELRGADMDLHFVKCFLPNREGSTNRAEGCFDWQCAWAACSGSGVIDAVRLQWQSGRFAHRISFSQFLTQFGALGLNSLEQFQREPTKAIEAILTQASDALQKGSAKVGNSMVLMTKDCFDALNGAVVKTEQGLTSVAEFVQQVSRAYSSGTRLQEDREKLVKLQACVRRRRVLGTEVARVSARRQFFGVMRVLQAVDLLKSRREAAITIEAHLRTTAARQQYQESLEFRRQYRLASRVVGVWETLKARRHLDELRSGYADIATVSGVLEACLIRKRLAKHVVEKTTMNLQSIRRGQLGRKRVEGAKDEQRAFSVIADAVNTLSHRMALTRELSAAVTLKMQSHRRGVLGRRQLLESRANNAAADTIFSLLETYFSRIELVRSRTEQANLIFQKDRRAVVSTRRVDDIREDKRAAQTARALFAAAFWRKRHKEDLQEQSTTKIQSLRRAKVANAKVENARLDMHAWKTIFGSMQTVLERRRMIIKRSMFSANKIQTNARGMLARKQTHTMKFVRLQHMLSGTYQSLRAKETILKLQAENLRTLTIRRLCCAFEAVAWRRQHVQRREWQAVLAIQKSYRGALGRRRAYHLRNIVAQEILHRLLRTFEAKRDFHAIVRRSKIQASVDLVCGVLQTVRLRGHHHMGRRHHKANALIQRIARGYLARRHFKDAILIARAAKSKRAFHGALRRFEAVQYLIDEKEDAALDAMNVKYHALLRTLQVRCQFQAFKKTVYFAKAAVVIQSYYRGWSTRRSPSVKLITAAINRVGLENKDRSLQRGHAAASMIQAIWRSWISRQVLLLPKVIHSLSTERTRIYEQRLAQVSTLKNFRNVAPTSDKETHILLGGTTMLNMAMPAYGHPTKKPYRNWGSVVTALDHRGEQMMELDFGKQHAITTCLSGSTYTYTCPDTFTTDEDAVLTEQNFVLTPLGFRGSLKDTAPKIIKVACGERHAVMISDEGLVFTWGMNDRSQCGVGNHLPERFYLTAQCLQKWGHHAPAGVHAKSHEDLVENLPRVKAISCGPNHSGMVDAEGQLWFWGCHSGIGLFNLKSVKGDLGIPSFLLFRMSQDIHKHHKAISASMSARQTPQKAKNGTRTPPDATQDPRKGFGLANEHLHRKGLFHSRPQSANAMNQTRLSFKDEDLASLDTEDGMHISHDILTKMKLTNAQAEQMGSLRFMLTEAQDFVAVKEISGDVHSPTRCCNLILSPANEAGRLRAAGTPVIDCWIDGWCSPVFPAPARGVHFTGIEIGSGVNTALSDRGYLYTWGAPERGQLGRQVSNRFKPAAPERVPFFPQLAISLSAVSVGVDHIIALTTHGRVFTWGKVDACLGPSGFQRCTLEEPMYVEGVLRELRVVQIAAGRLESAIATEGFDAVMGWEMLEMSSVGHRMLPVAYDYTFTGRKPGYSEAKFERLKMAQSDAVQCLLLGGRLPCGDDHLYGKEPFPDDETKMKGRHFMKKNDGFKKKTDLTKPAISKKPVAKGMAAREMFTWAEKNTKHRATQKHHGPTFTDPRLKRAAASMVSLGFASKARDILEVERDLAGFRRLALSRQDSHVIAVDSSEYKIRDYDAHEEAVDDRSIAETDLASSFVDSVDGAILRRSVTSVSRGSNFGRR